jgi:hypothetical protein
MGMMSLIPTYCGWIFFHFGDDQYSPSALVNHCVSALRAPLHGTNIKRGKYLLEQNPLSEYYCLYSTGSAFSDHSTLRELGLATTHSLVL